MKRNENVPGVYCIRFYVCFDTKDKISAGRLRCRYSTSETWRPTTKPTRHHRNRFRHRHPDSQVRGPSHCEMWVPLRPPRKRVIYLRRDISKLGLCYISIGQQSTSRTYTSLGHAQALIDNGGTGMAIGFGGLDWSALIILFLFVVRAKSKSQEPWGFASLFLRHTLHRALSVKKEN